ncbi:DNA topoisomerase [Aneurinibacillus thermoaerophilus]|uniref:DNA topoisomerase n=1 Tax=Aneurinibacillus thermoaerophilus TaxID=143495 RepID=UPI002E1AE3CA|nr:DNA topoisomerase [Aneurinibacillus thermoaerophilus]MED0738936.1 DNA topoisomerase [Aneurinibacillus thermoaerophilus]
MENTLILCEKPSAAKSIAEALIPMYAKRDGYFEGNNLYVTWCFGHMLELAEPNEYNPRFKKWEMNVLPILPNPFKLTVNPDANKQLNIIKKLASKCSLFVNAADAGREGELIAMEVYEYLGLTLPVKRLWTSSLVPAAIQKAYQQMKDGKEYIPLYQASQARRNADWSIGINATRALTVQHNTLLSAGRVQTPTLFLCYERQKEIENFKVETFYEVAGTFQQKNVQYEGTWQGPRLNKPEEAQAIIKRVQGKIGEIIMFQKKETKELPPRLYDLASLQQDANRIYGYSAQQTLDIAQKLYEKKHITYPRTSGDVIDESLIPEMHSVLKKIQGYGDLVKNADPSLVHAKNKQVCDPSRIEDHHAVLPTEFIPTQLMKDEAEIYDLIVRRFLVHFYPPALYEAQYQRSCHHPQTYVN